MSQAHPLENAGHVVRIPGGTAVLRNPATLSVRQKRPLQILAQTLGTRRYSEIIDARNVAPPPDDMMTPAQKEAAEQAAIDAQDALHLTRNEWAILYEMTDATIFALLDSWTIPVELPTSIDDVQEIADSGVYDALAVAAGAFMAEHIAKNGFGLEAIEHPESPTGASGESTPPSLEASSASSSTSGPTPDSGSTPTAPSLEG